MTTEPHPFAEFVRRCRKDRGLTQAEFAALFDGLVKQPQIGQWERAATGVPRAAALARLAELCGTTPGALLQMTGYAGAPDSLEAEIAATTAANPALRTLMRVAAELAPDQLTALTSVARAMARGRS